MFDLHIHTTATPHHSSWQPEALVIAAKQAGLRAIACADHNTTASVPALQAAAAAHGIVALSGVEIDSAFNGKLWHTLVYGANPNAPEVLALCDAVFARNMADAQALIATLSAAGFALPGLDALGRPPNVADVAICFARHNQVPGQIAGESDEERGMRFVLHELANAYNPPSVSEVIAVAHATGGVAILAHPGRSKGIYAIPAERADLEALAAVGLDGIEVYYPTHSAAQREFLRSEAERLGLLISGGSDSHHPHQPLAQWELPLARALFERLEVSP